MPAATGHQGWLKAAAATGPCNVSGWWLLAVPQQRLCWTPARTAIKAAAARSPSQPTVLCRAASQPACAASCRTRCVRAGHAQAAEVWRNGLKNGGQHLQCALQQSNCRLVTGSYRSGRDSRSTAGSAQGSCSSRLLQQSDCSLGTGPLQEQVVTHGAAAAGSVGYAAADCLHIR